MNLEDIKIGDLPFKNIGMGGAFDLLHEGHRIYLKLAFALAKTAYICISTNPHTARKKHDFEPLEKRVQNVNNFLKEIGCSKRAVFHYLSSFEEVKNFYIENDIVATITEPDYFPIFKEVNEIRRVKRKTPIIIVLLPRKLDENFEEISSTRIRGKSKKAESKMTNISSIENISTKDIEDTKLVSKLPELYELKVIIENSPWHKNESAFIHTLRVLDNLNDIFKFGFLDSTKRKHIQAVLKMPLLGGSCSKKNLLRLAALLHDLGKKETFKKKSDGITYAPKHEVKSVDMVPEIAKRFQLNHIEINYLKTIILFHTEATIAASNAVSEKKKRGKEKIEELKIKLKNCFTELLLLTLADHRTSLEKQNAPKQYGQKEVFLIDEIAKSIH